LRASITFGLLTYRMGLAPQRSAVARTATKVNAATGTFTEISVSRGTSSAEILPGALEPPGLPHVSGTVPGERRVSERASGRRGGCCRLQAARLEFALLHDAVKFEFLSEVSLQLPPAQR
jgi:hypothetical protein